MSAPAIRHPESRVYETADDAAVSKLSAIRHGYFNDPFLGLFVRRFQRRSPLINRGYFSRFLAVDTILRRFLAVCDATGDGARSQIISLGAGFDSSFFRLANQGIRAGRFFEVDFPDVTVRKAAIIAKHAPLLKLVAGQALSAEEKASLDGASAAHSAAEAGLGGFGLGMGLGSRTAARHAAAGASTSAPAAGSGSPLPAVPEGVTLTMPTSPTSASSASASASSSSGAAPTPAPGVFGSSGAGASIAGPGYRLVTADLRDIAAMQAALRGAGLDPTAPTLLLSECVLVYLEPEDSCAIIAWAAQALERAVFVTYEQIRPHDAFGQIMARNLAERGYSLRGLSAFPDIPSQRARYLELGFHSATVADMNDVYYRLLPPAEVAAAERRELFDEVEEWHLMSAHYCIAVAVKERDRAAGAPKPSAGSAAGSSSTAAIPAAGGAAVAAAVARVAPLRTPIDAVESVDGVVVAAAGSGPGAAATSGSAADGSATPQELAAAVVHAHESASASARASGRGRAGSGSAAAGSGAAGAVAAASSGSATPAGGALSPDALPPNLRAMTDAIARATGTAVDGVELSDAGSVSLASGPSSSAAGGESSPRFALGGAGGSAASPAPSVGSASGTGSGSIAALHTRGGEVVFASHGGGSTGMDFEAMAEADAEIRAARHMRESAGMNAEMQRGRSGSIEHLGGSGASGRSPVKAAGAAGAGAGAAAVPAIAPYTAAEVAARGARHGGGTSVSLNDMLFPVAAWAHPGGGATSGRGGPAAIRFVA